MTVKAKAGNGIEHKFFSLKNFKAVDEGPGSFSGTMNNFGFLDDGADITIKGAFAGVLESFLRCGFAANSHDWDVASGVIGYPMDAKETDDGIWVDFKFHSTEDAQLVRTKAKERLADGKEVGVSIGYKSGNTFFVAPKDYQTELPKYLKPEYLEEGLAKAATFPRVRILASVSELAECSIVARQMNTLSHVDSMKGADGEGDGPADQLSLIDDAAAGALASIESLTAQIAALNSQLAEAQAKAASSESGEGEVKIGATISASNKKKLQQIHDNAAAMEATVCSAAKSAVVVGDQVKGMYEDALAEMTTPTLWQVYYAFLDVLDMIEDLPDTVGDAVVDRPALIEEALAAMVTAMRQAALAKLDEPDVEYIYWGAPPESFKTLSSDLVTEPFDIHNLAVVSAVREHAARSGAIKQAVEVFIDRAREKQEFRNSVDGRPVSALARARKAELDKGLKDASENDNAAAEKSESLVLLEPEDLSAQMRGLQLRFQRANAHAS